MSGSKKVRLGFRVVNVKTGEVLSEIFKKRAPAREIAARLYKETGVLTGVQTVEEYVARDPNNKKDQGAFNFDAPPPPKAAEPTPREKLRAFMNEPTHKGIANFAEKRAARLERMKARQERMARVAESSHARARQIGSHIPMGQPILVGHHSERRHRADIKRIDQAMRKSIEASKEAQTLERKIERVEHGRQAISSDDPEAVLLLREKLATLEDQHARILEANKILKKGDVTREDIPKLRELLSFWGGDPMQRLIAWRQLAHKTIPTTNSSAEMRRVKMRIAELMAKASAPVRATETHGDVSILEEDNRVQIRFPGKPSDSVRSELKAHGFRWAPSVGAWQRMASHSAWYDARQIVGKLAARDPRRHRR